MFKDDFGLMGKRLDKVYYEYNVIMSHERRLRSKDDQGELAIRTRHLLNKPGQVYNMVWRIFEVAKSSLVPRSYNSRYGLDRSEVIYESVGGHANLVSEIIGHILDVLYGGNFGHYKDGAFRTVEGYAYREIIEAVRLHDLAENELGDIPDNEDEDRSEKEAKEMAYFEKYLSHFPASEEEMRQNVLSLLKDMYMKSSETGRILYLSDKVAATIITLCLDLVSKPERSDYKSPTIRKDSPYLSDRDKREMAACDWCVEDYCRASEMWLVDFFEERHLNRYDETFFFTAIIVMSVLLVHGQWYIWREKSYTEDT